MRKLSQQSSEFPMASAACLGRRAGQSCGISLPVAFAPMRFGYVLVIHIRSGGHQPPRSVRTLVSSCLIRRSAM